MESGVGGGESSEIRHFEKYAKKKIRRCHSARGVIYVDRRWYLQVARNFGRKTRRLSDDMVPSTGREERNNDLNKDVDVDVDENKDEDGDKHQEKDKNGVGAVART